MKHLLLIILLLPTIASAQSVVAKHQDGTTWLLYADTLSVGERQDNGDRLVSALVEKRDAQGRSVHRARQYTTGCYVHSDGVTRWGDVSSADEWTWAGPLILDIIATRSCQRAWERIEPDADISVTEPVTFSRRQ